MKHGTHVIFAAREAPMSPSVYLRSVRGALCAAAIALPLLGASSSAQANQQGTPYSVSSNGETATLQLQQVSQQYCYFEGIKNTQAIGSGYISWANGYWTLNATGQATAYANCFPYAAIEDYDKAPSMSYYPGANTSAGQWYSQQAPQSTWDTQAFCSIGGIEFNSALGGNPEYRILNGVQGAPQGCGVASWYQSVNTPGAASRIPNAIESQCLWFPGAGSPGFYVSPNTGTYASITAPGAHLPSPGEIVLYEGANGADLGSDRFQLCAPVDIFNAADANVFTAYVSDDPANGVWRNNVSTAFMYVACIYIDQVWPGDGNGGSPHCGE
jgi:hypothetical protein